MGTALYCNVTSSAWMTEINYQKTTIMERINAELGYKAVTEIILRIGPVKTIFKSKIAPVWNRKGVTAGIKDEKLRTLIKRVIGKSR